jgi:hypothetical protein
MWTLLIFSVVILRRLIRRRHRRLTNNNNSSSIPPPTATPVPANQSERLVNVGSVGMLFGGVLEQYTLIVPSAWPSFFLVIVVLVYVLP